jgi:hypothetical protein
VAKVEIYSAKYFGGDDEVLSGDKGRLKVKGGRALTLR